MNNETNPNLDLFSNVDLTDEEYKFIKSILEIDGNANQNYSQRKIVLSIFHLSKNIEKSSESNDKHSSKMFWLTLALVFFGLIQVIELILKLCNKI